MEHKDLIDALRKLTKPSENLTSFFGQVIEGSYKSDKQTVDVKPIDGSADLHDVLINSNNSKGFILVPKDNSVVAITLTSNLTGYVSMVSDVDAIYLNGDNEDGLVKINDLKTQYDSFVNGIKAACVAGFTALVGLDSGASLTAFNNAANSIFTLNKTTLENTKIKHGSN